MHIHVENRRFVITPTAEWEWDALFALFAVAVTTGYPVPPGLPRLSPGMQQLSRELEAAGLGEKAIERSRLRKEPGAMPTPGGPLGDEQAPPAQPGRLPVQGLAHALDGRGDLEDPGHLQGLLGSQPAEPLGDEGRVGALGQVVGDEVAGHRRQVRGAVDAVWVVEADAPEMGLQAGDIVTLDIRGAMPLAVTRELRADGRALGALWRGGALRRLDGPEAAAVDQVRRA